MRLETRIVKKARRRSELRGWKLVLQKLQRYQISVLVGLAVCIMAVAGFVLARSSPAVGDWRIEVVTVAHQVVRDTVREELRTAFSTMDETQIEEIEGGKYLVGGWVDLISEEGHTDRQHYSCTLHRDDQDSWVAENVTVTPQ